MPYTIRLMTEGDLPSRAAVHCQAWEETYRGLIPDAVLDGMTPEAIAARAEGAADWGGEEDADT